MKSNEIKNYQFYEYSYEDHIACYKHFEILLKYVDQKDKDFYMFLQPNNIVYQYYLMINVLLEEFLY